MRRPALHGWRPALRIAWRDALRHRGRSVLVLVMIALPVLAVSAAAMVIRTADVSGLEGVDRHLGAADARIRTEGRGPVVQAPDATDGQWFAVDGIDTDDPVTEVDVRAVLGEDVRFVPIAEEWSRARVGDRVVEFATTGVDLSDPLAEGLFELETGRLPAARGEVVVNHAMLDKGFAVGDDLDTGDAVLRIVGAGRDATARTQPVVLGAHADLGRQSANVREWLVEAGPVTWSQVLELNQVGALVTSRTVLADPPDVASMAEQLGYDTTSDETLAVVALVVVMALIEVVLLAGPAFAVGARRHARTLALIAASGGTPAQARRVILGSGLVLGLVASAFGIVGGILAGWLALPLVQRFQGEWFGPVELPWLLFAAIAGFGLVSAVLASVVPAWLASRQDVVAVLAGRRGDRRPRASTPVVGLVLLGVGIAASAYGAATSADSSGAVWIAGSAIVSVLGMILVVPVVVSAVARVAGRLPLVARYAARDAARHRTRTVPAVAAVAATVAGVVALGIANASDERENEQTYVPMAPMGSGYVSWGQEDLMPGEESTDPEDAWSQIEQVVREQAPGVDVQRTRGVQELVDGEWVSTYVEPPRELEDEPWGVMTAGPAVAVAASAAELGIAGESATTVDRALAAGRAVLFVQSTAAREVTVTLRRESYDDDSGETVVLSADPVPTQLVPWTESTAPAGAVLPESIARDLDLPLATASLRLAGDLGTQTHTRIEERLAAAVPGTYVYVERGYQRPDEAVVVLLVLFTLGGVLMLGGTLTATFLALADARPDLATFAAVGAAPRARRGVAASYALVVGFVGAVLGAGVGFIPGIAISRPLTSFSDSGPYLAIPWLMIGALVLVLPLVTAAIVGAAARSRLPMVARLA